MSDPSPPCPPAYADADSAWWWEALADDELLLPRCAACGRFRFPPMPSCPQCGADGAGERVAASRRGRIYSWVVVEHALDPAFEGDLPYTILTVELDEGPRVFGRLLDPDVRPRDGAPVRAVTYRAGDRVLLGFVPADAATGGA